MKRFKIFYTLLILGLLSGCEDVLKEKQQAEWTDQDVWRIPEMAEGVLHNAYSAISSFPDDGTTFSDAATDNAVTNRYGSGIYKVAMGGITTSTNPLDNWGTCYGQLQYIHRFLENGLSDKTVYNHVDPETDQRTKERLEGEAYFLRAWWSFQLLMEYGGKTASGAALGYPIVLKSISEDAAAVNDFQRNSYAECAAQIIADCNRAMELLPDTYTGSDPVIGDANVGRASRFAAAVLKSRVALYAASPAYQPDAITRITGMGSFTISDEASYIDKWEYAAMVADSVLQLDGFGNFQALQATDIADAGNTTPDDFVFRKYFNNKGLETRNFPPAYYGNAQTVPSQNLVDAFPTLDGFPVDDPRANVDPNAPYANRDKRLDLNVYYQGRTYGTSGQPVDVSPGGRDSYTFNVNCSRTGYYLAKFISTKEGMLNPVQSSNAIHYNPLLRKSEVFLNYAEAANEAWGPNGKGPNCKYTAYEVIKMVRKSSGGITNTTYLDEVAAEGKDSFRKLIQNERRLEFTFENQRYYDMRRWLLPLDEPVKGVEVTRTSTGYSYSVVEVEPRKMGSIRYYYAPIPYDEIIKNPKLVNNIGWE